MKKTYIDPEIQMLTVASADVITISGEDRTISLSILIGLSFTEYSLKAVSQRKDVFL